MRVRSETELIHEIVCMVGSCVAAMALGGMAVLILHLTEVLRMKTRSLLAARMFDSHIIWRNYLDKLNRDTSARLFGVNSKMCAIALAASYFISFWVR